MAKYTVELELKGRYDKPVVADSLKEARRIAVEMLLGGLTTPRRYNQVFIYEGEIKNVNSWDPTYRRKIKYIVRATNYYGGKVNPFWTTFAVYGRGLSDGHILYSDGSIKRRY